MLLRVSRVYESASVHPCNAPAGTAARALRRPSAGTGRRRRRRWRGGRRTATAAASCAARTGRPCRPAPSARARCRGWPLPAALTIGVNDVPPMPPRLVMVKQPPCISSSDSLPLRAFSDSWASSAGELDDVLRVDVANDRHEEAAVGIDGDADVHVLLGDDRFGGEIDRRVELRKHLQRRRHHLQRDRRHGEMAACLFHLLGVARAAALRAP